MNHRLAALALLGAVGCAGPAFHPLDPRAQHVGAGAVAWWYGNDSAHLDASEKPIAELLRHGCAVSKMGQEKSAFFTRTSAFADRAIKSDDFATMVKSKTTWELTHDSGSQIMDRLRWLGVQVNVFMY